MRYEISALGIGGILDQAVQVVKDRFGLLFSIMLVLQVPFGLLLGFSVRAATTVELPSGATPEQIVVAQAAALQGQLPVLVVGGLVWLLFVFPLTNAAVVHAIANIYVGKPVTVGSAYRRAFGILVPLILTAILWYLAIMGGFILLIIPGILFAFWFALWTYVLIIEGKTGSAALSRSKELMRGNVGTLIVLGVLIWVINFGVNLAAGAIPQPHLAIVVSTVAEAGLFLFAAAAFVVFYFSCRCKLENFDLTLLAESMEAETAHETIGGEVFDDDDADSRH